MPYHGTCFVIFITLPDCINRYKNQFKVIYQQFIAIYDSGCQIYCNWSRLKTRFKVPAHRSTMPQINMIPQSL